MENLNPQKTEGFSAIFANLPFLLLWFAQIASQLADRIFVYVLMLLVYSLTHSNLGVALPLLSFGIPSVLVSPWAGVLVDKLDRKGTLLVSDLLRGLLILLIIPIVTENLLWIFFVSLLIYSVTQFFAPAETATIPELVEKKNLILANSLFMVTWMASSVIGFGLGAPLVGILAEKRTVLAAALLYFVSAFFILLLPLKGKAAPTSKSHIFQDLLMGFEFIRRKEIVRYALFKLFVASMAIATLSLLSISYASQVLKIGEQNFGYLIIAVGAGMFLGMGSLERLRHYLKKGTLVVISFILSGIVLFALAKIADLKLALLLILLLGMANLYITSTIQTILQERIPRQIRGRVFGVQNMLINSAFIFPVVIFGGLADMLGVNFSLSFLGGVLFLTGMAGIFLPKFRTV